MLCRLFFQIYIKIKLKLLKLTSLNQAEEQIIKIKLKLLKLTSLKDIKEQIIKIKTEITEIDIAERYQRADNQN